ncbi:P-loop containing nucleoside triphosphate hydrolase protein [Dichotomocladium elegans]|nr:P-loop containing nucleoside triphosphate hydrolase protein [Dichotomocladium elegans]
MAPMYYRGAHAAILVYDITSEESFDDVNAWAEELQRNMTDDLVIYIVGNKVDLAPEGRAISIKKVEEYADKIIGQDCPVYEVSAKEDEGKFRV